MAAGEVERVDTARREGMSRLSAGLSVCMLTVYFVSGVGISYDPDMFHCLALAREIVAGLGIPQVDLFAYTPTRAPVVHHEWAEALLLYWVTITGGAAGVTILKYGVELAIMGGVYGLAIRQGAGLATLTVLGPLGMLMSWPGMTTFRAHVLTLLFTVVLLWFLDADRRGSRRWIAPYCVLHVLWLNCHGGFVVGPALVGVHAAEQWLRGRPVRHLVLLLAALLALVSLNPYGFAYYGYLWRALGMDRSAIVEWLPLGRGEPVALLVWSVSAVVWLYGVRKAGWRDAPGFLLVAVSGLAALRYQRHVSLYALVWLAQVAPLIERLRLGTVLGRLLGVRPALTAALLVAMIAWRGSTIVRERSWEMRLPANPGEHGSVLYPVGAVDYLDRIDFHGNLLTPFEAGAFVSWKLHPRVKVSLDGRYEVAYDPSLLVEHYRFFHHAPSWRGMLTRYPTDAALVLVGWAVEAPLREDPDWRVAYEDDAFVLFARRDLDLPYSDRRGVRLEGQFP